MLLIRKIWVLLLLLLPLSLRAQVDEALEQWVEESGSEESAAELHDLLLQLADQPVNLNDTVSIASLPFLSPFQVRALKNYIILHGQLWSLKELRMVPGFDSATVALIGPLVKVEPYEPGKAFSMQEILRGGHHSLVAGVGDTRAGDSVESLRALFCYTYQYGDHVSLRLSGDRDPGEAWGKDNFYSYHLKVSHVGCVETLVVGRYSLQFGQGVTLWTGFRPFGLLGSTPVRFGSGVRAASAFYETGWQEGIAATLALGKGFSLSAFGSRHDGEWFGGSHLTYRRGNLIVGLTATATFLDDSVQLRDYTYNGDYFRGDRQAAVGLDAVWQRDRLLLFGEAAVDHQGAPALLGGLRLSAGGDNSFGLSFRHFDPRYHNLHAGAYCVGETRNEQGATFDARLHLPLETSALLSVDLHRFPSLRYGSYRPSSGAWLRAQLSRPFGKKVEASLRMAWRQKQRNVPNIDSTLYLGEETERAQLQGQVRVSMRSWRLSTRAVFSRFDADRSASEWGWLVAQEVRYATKRWNAVMQAAWFDVGGYNARIYLGESNLQYAYSLPMLTNCGMRVSLVIHWELTRWLALGFKGATTAYWGDDAPAERTRPAWHLQLRCKF